MFSVFGVHKSLGLPNLTLSQTLCEETHVVTIVCMLRSSFAVVLLHEQLFAAPLQTLIGLGSHREEVQRSFLQNLGSGGSKCSDIGESFFKCNK